MAIRTLARDITVGEELLGLLVVELFRGLFSQFALIVEFAEPICSKLMMRLTGCATIDIEGDAELLKRVLDHLMITVYDILRGDALLAGTDGDGHTMLVRTTDKQHFALLQTEIAHIDISGHIHTGQMTDVHTAIGVWQRRRHRRALVSLIFHSSIRINQIRLQNYK